MKPESSRGPQLARSAKATRGGTPEPGRTLAGPPRLLSIESSPSVESTLAGSRIATTVPSTKTRKA